MTLFARPPLRMDRGIPVFSESSSYLENYEQIARDHLDEMARTGHNPFISEATWRASEISTIALIRRHVAKGGRILDAGVGLGRILGELPELDRHGIDISLDYLEKARDKGIDVAMSLIEDMPYVPHAFDAILATDVLEHVLDLNASLRALTSALRPGGVLIVRTPDREDLSGYLEAGYPYEFAHLRAFDEFSLRLLLERTVGLQVIAVSRPEPTPDARYLRAGPAVPALLARAYTKLVGRPMGRVPRLGGWLTREVYRPVEINVVARKPS